MKNLFAWSWHVIAGVALAYLLGMHMFIMHLDDIGGVLGMETTKAVSFTAVLERGRQAAFAVSYLLLLVAALYHGLYGLRTIVFELTLSPRTEWLLTAMFWLIGAALLVYGAVAIVNALRMAG